MAEAHLIYGFHAVTSRMRQNAGSVREIYLDLSGEVLVIESLARRHRDFTRRRIMVVPAVGYEVVASDCLAATVWARRRDAIVLRVATTPAAWAKAACSRAAASTGSAWTGAGTSRTEAASFQPPANAKATAAPASSRGV